MKISKLLAIAICWMFAGVVSAQAGVAKPVAHIDVQVMASDYIKLHGHKISKKEKAGAEKNFIAGFREGFREVGDIAGLDEASSDPFEAGYKAGAQYWMAFPDKRDLIMAGFGYQKLQAKGQWQRAFESSLFTSQNGLSCWLSPMEKAVVGVPESRDGFQYETVQVEINGYLSPDGSFGHLGRLRCEILAMSVRRISD